MAGSIIYRHISKKWRITGVFASLAAYLADRNIPSSKLREGDIYYDTTLNQLRTFDGSSFSPAGQNSLSPGGWDAVIAIGAKVTNDNAAEIELSAATSSLLTLDANGTTNVDILDISSAAGSGDLINLTQAGSGVDIRGTGGSWSVTKVGLATLTDIVLGDSEAVTFGGSSDSILQWDSAKLALTAIADSVFRIGAAAFSYDVEFIGQTAVTNLMKWDLDGGADSVGALVFDNTDIDMGQNDLIRFGDSQEFTLSHDGTQLVLAGDDQIFHLGVAGAGFDMIWYTENTGDHVFFDEDNALVDFIDVNIDLDNDAIVRWGDSNDITMQFDGTDFLIDGANANTILKIGATNNQDIIIYGATITNLITFDTDNSALLVTFENFDLKLNDDDYILLGTSATAGASSDATLRWDNTNSVLEIIGNTTFEGAEVIVENNLTVSGTLTLSGAIAPGSIAMGDGEELTFGDGSDLTISATGTTATIAILAGSDLAITGDSGNEMTIGAAANLVNLTLSGTLDIGADDKGYDVSFFAENSGDLVLWDQDAVSSVGAFIFTGSCAYFTDSSGVGDSAILLGTGDSSAGDFSIRGTSGEVLLINQVSSGDGTIEIGVSGKGITTTWHSETASAFMKWNQTAEQLQLDGASLALGDGDQILLGDTLGTGDFVISSTSNVLTLNQVTAGDDSTIIIGADDDGMDITIHGDTASSQIKWTTASDSLVFTDAPIVFDGNSVDYTFTTSTDAMLITATDGTAAKVTWGDNGTNGLDQEWLSVSAGNLLNWDAGTETLKFTDIKCSMIGANNRGTILTISGVDVGTDSDTVLIDHSGAGNAINIDLNEADSSGINIEPFTNSTVAALEVDGNTAGWLGVTGIGMVHLKDDIALGNANATLLMIEKSAAIAEVNTARGSCLTILEDMNVASSGPAYAVHINSTNNSALNVASGASVFADKVTCTAGLQSSSVALEAQIEANQQTIPAGTAFVTVSIANDINDVIILPVAVIGNVIRITVPTTGCELQTFVAGSDTINTVDCSGANELALVAGSIYTLICTKANTWVATGTANDGTNEDALLPDTDS